MLIRAIKNSIRRPWQSLAILLFAMVLTVVLCYLHASSMEEQEGFEKTYASVPVTFRVTDLDGSKPGTIPGWYADLFTERGLKPNLDPYVGELYLRVSREGELLQTEIVDGQEEVSRTPVTAAGVGSLYVAEELTENWGGQVYWKEGYDESILTTDALVCLVPEKWKDLTELRMQFSYAYIIDFRAYQTQTEKTVQVVGYYVDSGNCKIYCPYSVMYDVHAELGAPKELEELCAVLNDNSQLPELREVAAQWFAEPNPTGKETEWGHYGYDYYFLALDIDDVMLRNLESNLKSSIQLNQIAAIVVFILSAGAGFLTGFLVIRSRKREIALMRTTGASQLGIFAQLSLEQMLCILTGIALGGSYALWQPIGRLGLFAGIYFIGLSVALLIFLRKNLLTTIKEDE